MAAAFAALALGAVSIWALWPVLALEVVDDTAGRVITRLAAAGEAPLRLSYVHSIYRQPGAEEFVVRSEGLELVRLASPSEAVLEYYARPEPIALQAGTYEIRTTPELHPRLAVLVGTVGQRTVTYAGRQLPLHQLAPDGERIALQVVRAPRIVLLTP